MMSTAQELERQLVIPNLRCYVNKRPVLMINADLIGVPAQSSREAPLPLLDAKRGNKAMGNKAKGETKQTTQLFIVSS